MISLLFACETSFLGFELDLLTHEFLVNSICWISTLRNPWYSYFSSIYFSYSDFCSFLSGCSYPETPDITLDTPDHQTRSIRVHTRSIRASLCLTFFLSVLNCRFPIHSPPPLSILRSLQLLPQDHVGVRREPPAVVAKVEPPLVPLAVVHSHRAGDVEVLPRSPQLEHQAPDVDGPLHPR